MSDRLFFGLAALVAIGLIALALVWPPRAETGLDEARAAPPAPSAAPAQAQTAPPPAAAQDDEPTAAAESAGE